MNAKTEEQSEAALYEARNKNKLRQQNRTRMKEALEVSMFEEHNRLRYLDHGQDMESLLDGTPTLTHVITVNEEATLEFELQKYKKEQHLMCTHTFQFQTVMLLFKCTNNLFPKN